MTISELVSNLMKTPELFAVIVTASIAAASALVSLVEYYWRKSYYDHFRVADFGRRGPSSILQPDFLLYGLLALAVIPSLALALPWSDPAGFMMGGPVDFRHAAVTAAIVSAVVAAMSIALFFLFHHELTKEPRVLAAGTLAWDSLKFGLVGGLVTMAVLTTVAALYVLLHQSLGVGQVLSIVLALAALFVLAPVMAYCWSRWTFPLRLKSVVILKEGANLVVLETVGGCHYCIRAEVSLDDIVFYINDAVLVPLDSGCLLERRYFRSLRPLGRVGKSIKGPDSGAKDEADDGSPASGSGDSQVRREAMGHG